MKRSKNYQESLKLVDKAKLYDTKEAVETVVSTSKAKFDETVEIHRAQAVVEGVVPPVKFFAWSFVLHFQRYYIKTASGKTYGTISGMKKNITEAEVLSAQLRNELTESAVYARLAAIEKNPENRKRRRLSPLLLTEDLQADIMQIFSVL